MGLVEECVGVDQKMLQEVIIPRIGGLIAWVINVLYVNLWQKGV